MIPWKKQGRIFVPSGAGVLKTHAARAVPLALDDRTLRLFFSSRDSEDRMLPTYIDVSIQDPSQVLDAAPGPLMELGRPGAFDDSGITLGSVVEHEGRVLFYYTGWKRRRVVSFELSIGVLVWDGQRQMLQRMFEGPILAQDRRHPLLVAGPFVVVEGRTFKMWYCSGSSWEFPGGYAEPIYTVHYAESENGLDWAPAAARVIEPEYDGEVISAPWVEKRGEQYRMWYCKRGFATKESKAYSIGYAESRDGRDWKRLDERAGITRSPDGWDSEMICYPALFRHHDRLYMFYSGNSVGKGGLGYAVADCPAGQI